MPAEHRVRTHPAGYLEALRADVRSGLTAAAKTLPPKYFYDARGSELFDEITRLPEVAAPPVSRAGRVASAVARGLRSCRTAVLHCVPFRNARQCYQVTRKAQARTGIRPRPRRPVQRPTGPDIWLPRTLRIPTGGASTEMRHS